MTLNEFIENCSFSEPELDINKIKDDYGEIEYFNFATFIFHDIMKLCVGLVQDDSIYLQGEEDRLSLEQSIILGSMVRLSKLMISTYNELTKYRSDLLSIFQRVITETCINVKYFIKENTESTFKNYLKQSLVDDKQNYLGIKSDENGEFFDKIGKRVLSGIEERYKRSGYSLEEINRSHKYKSIKKRTVAVYNEQFYSLNYGLSSSTVHGNWSDLYWYHLKNGEDGKFNLNPSWNEPSIKHVTPMNLITCDTIISFCEYIMNTTSVDSIDLFLNKAIDYMDKARLIDVIHEELMEN